MSDAAEFEAVQALLKARSPAMNAPRIVSGPTLLTGICFCAARGGAMTLRTGEERKVQVLHLLHQGSAGPFGPKVLPMSPV
jgi:site-specific DNA recombinase